MNYVHVIVGTIPSSIGLLNNLIGLYLDHNYLNGSLMSYDLNNVLCILIVDILCLNILGHIPSSIGSLTNLINLYLDSCCFSGNDIHARIKQQCIKIIV